MSLLLNCASAVIDITAKAASLLFTVSQSTVPRTLLGFGRQCRAGTQLPALVGPLILERPSEAAGPQTSTWPQVAVQATYINMGPSSIMPYHLQCGFRLQQGLGYNTAFGCNSDHRQERIFNGCKVSSFSNIFWIVFNNYLLEET